VEIPLFTNGNFALVTVKIMTFFQPKPSFILGKKRKKKIPFAFLFPMLLLMTHAMAFATYF